MDYNVTYQELADELSRLGHSKVFTAVALQLSDQPHKYEVKRWVSYLVPVTKHWTPWTNPSGLLDYDYGTWRIVQIEQDPTQFMDMLTTWIKNDNHLLMDNVWIRLTVDKWERQRTWSHQGDNNRRQIPYPTLWYRPSNQYEQLHPDYDLVAPNLPYFPTTNEAFASLIDGVDLRFITNRSLEGSRFNVFILDDNPFIEKASLHMDKCDIVVGGTNTTECELKIFDDFGTEYIQSIDHTGQYSVNWSGIPGYAVFVLTRNFELLDKVIYSRQPFFGANRNVQVNLDKDSSLEALVEYGEGQDIEFKNNLPKDKGDKEFVETVCAFANTNDGIIIVGVSDQGEIHGIGSNLPEKYEESLSNKIRNLVDPVPSFSVETQNYHGRWVILVKVKKGEAVYALNAASIPVCYRRHGSNDFPAKLSQLNEMFSNVNQFQFTPNLDGIKRLS
jgi:hypothetical protein